MPSRPAREVPPTELPVFARSVEQYPCQLDIDRQLRETVSLALKGCSESRHQIAATMSEVTCQDVSKGMLDSWTAESKERHRFPVIFLPAFEIATGSTLVTQLLGRARGFEPMFAEHAVFARIAQLDHQAAQLDAERERLRAKLARPAVEGRR